mgnify:CR=1 FL=1
MSLDIDEIVERAISESKNRQELWRKLIVELDCKSLCEIGVWKGEFAQVLLENVESIKCYTLIDPWQNLANWNKPANKSDIEFESIRNEALGRISAFEDKIIEIRDTTKNARKKIEDESLDFVYIDGDHTLRGITLDLLSILPKVKRLGYIGGDDFTKTIWQHGDEFSPTEVFPFALYFAEALDLKIYTLPYQQFLILNDPSGFCVKDYGNYASLTPAQIYSKPHGSFKETLTRKLPIGVKNLLKTVLLRVR